MNTEQIQERLQSVFRDIFDRPALNISRETTAHDIEEWDSLANVSLIVSIEKEFGIKFSLVETRTLKNVGSVIDLIVKKDSTR